MTLLSVLAALAVTPVMAQTSTPPLTVSDNGRYVEAGGKPFFWLGDTGWLLLGKLNREETEAYFAKRASQGYNVIQVMVLHRPEMTNPIAGPALIDGDVAQPRVTPGNDPAKPGEYDYWDHLDWVIDRAAAHGLYLALVPAWGTFAEMRILNVDTAPVYGRFIAERYKDKPNIVWLNGGDTHGDMATVTWQTLGKTIKAIDPNHLMTFHPFGRTDSSWTFHNATWLDFNMFQSGHQSYEQDTTRGAYGEDNWEYILNDWARRPARPVIDGEPSYENIPHGLDFVPEPLWKAPDVRRYAWWSVMAGAFGHTYGENSVMQFHVPGAKSAYWASTPWQEAVDSPGALQMQHLKTLILSRPSYLDRVADQSLIIDNGTRYERVAATRGAGFAIAYSYTGKPFRVQMGKISGKRVRAAWFDPRTGETQPIGTFANRGTRLFTPPGTPAPGNDWALVLDDAATPSAP
ncbi:glycoside hydrolase family 140 protein [Hephaestia sp. GCM10023244]|uniref:glycoside hydrolase family 140 protein n=1 Tax=unclassified Hephaestia TaxID=2631281 RepID=UPI00207793EE|nr:glycoside hydrolase family 140 protein [Hephaestia sp. MAHUQ-44]MCM8732166.1 glycoside hydrolase family 140 protein [Hephaestia sp. MAHUQ-44]